VEAWILFTVGRHTGDFTVQYSMVRSWQASCPTGEIKYKGRRKKKRYIPSITLGGTEVYFHQGGSLLLWRYSRSTRMLACATYHREHALAGGWTR